MATSKKPENKPKIQHTSSFKKLPKNAGFWQAFWYKFTAWSVSTKFWQKLGIGLVAFTLLLIGSMYGIAQWYISKHKNAPLQMGTTFIPDYARHFDLDPKETLDAIFSDLGVKRVRLVSYWENHEPTEGVYNFDELDWQFEMAKQHNAKVSLAIGLRQPRWPECHMPNWAAKLPGNQWRDPLYEYIETVVKRYKDHPSLESYQLENEYFLSVFGICTDFDRDRLEFEYNMVKKIDPDTTLIVSRSNNAVPSWPVGEPRADLVGAAIYKRVWDKTITRRYFEYPVPAWYYAFLAGATELTTGKETFVHELQTEPWVETGIKTATLEEQYKTMSPDRLVHRIDYARGTGMRTIDLWGTEWWYWLKTQRNAPEIWDTARNELQKIEQSNSKLAN